MPKVLFVDITLEQMFGLTPLSLYFRQGIGSISSVLKKHDHETAFLVLTHLDAEKINITIQNFKPDLIAVSSTTGPIKIAESIISFIHHDYNTPIILGGIHATIMPEEAIKIKGVTAICIGEGEQPLLELANQLNKKKQNPKIKNIWYKKNGKIIKNPIRNLIPDLDKLPFADRNIFNPSLKEKSSHAEISAGRGCPYNCTICVNHTLQKIYKNKGQFVRTRSVKNVIQEIECLVKSHKGLKIINFYDETFTLDKHWLKKFCEEYRKKIGLSFMCSTRIDMLDQDTISLMKKAGCTEIRVGLESGDDNIRKRIVKKNINKSKIIKICELIKKEAIRLSLSTVIGLPYETEDTIKETIELNRHINPDIILYSTFRPYPKTKLYDLCKAKGWIGTEEAVSHRTRFSMLNQPSISKEKIAYYYNIFPWAVKYPKLTPIIKLLNKIKVYDPIVDNYRLLADTLYRHIFLRSHQKELCTQKKE